jgi:integrase
MKSTNAFPPSFLAVPPNLRAIYALAACQGPRRQELVAVKWADVDFGPDGGSGGAGGINVRGGVCGRRIETKGGFR